MKINFVIVWALTAALAGFLFGFDTAVISGAEQAVQSVWKTDDVTHGLAISSALWGTVIGALFGGFPSDIFGRKKTLIGIGVLYALSAIGSAFAWDPASFMVFRIIGGLGVGASSVAAPAYISEIASKKDRGKLVALYQAMIVIGILVAYTSNYVLGGVGENDWRWMLGVEAVPALLYLAAVFFVPESPRWLATRKDDLEGARAILRKINPDTVEETLANIDAQEHTVSIREFFSGRFARPIMFAFLIALFNQLSGINAIIYYAPRIFELAGSETSAAMLATMGVGVVNLAFTIVGLALIDRAGRRALMTIGSIGYIGSLGMVAYGFASGHYALVPLFIFTFIASHAIGQGAVIWVYISEVFSNAARAKGQALGTGTHWVSAAALTFVMPSILSAFAPAVIFVFFAVMMVFQLIFVRVMMVESRGRSLEEFSSALMRPPR